MKKELAVNFTNILGAAFGPIFLCQKITKPTCKYMVEKSCPKTHSYEKAIRIQITILLLDLSQLY